MQKNEKKERTACEIYRAMLFDYVSDILSEQEKADFLMHIADCPECREELSLVEETINAASELEDVEVPEEVREAVSAALSEEAGRIRKRRSIRRYVTGTILPVAACAALAVGIYSGGLYDKVNEADRMLTGPIEEVNPQNQDNEENTALNEGVRQEGELFSESPDKDVQSGSTEANMSERKPTGRKSAPTDKERTSGTDGNNSSEKADTDADTADIAGADTAASDETAESSNSANEADEMPDYMFNYNTLSADTRSVDDTKNEQSKTSAEEVYAEGIAEGIRISLPMSGGGGVASGGSAAAPAKAKLNDAAAAGDAEEARDAYDIPSNDSVEEGISDEECETACVTGAGEEEDEDDVKEKDEPAYCTVVVDNPEKFVKGFGISGKRGNTIHFTIEASRWREFVNYCRSYGAYVNADMSDDFAYVNVRVTCSK